MRQPPEGFSNGSNFGILRFLRLGGEEIPRKGGYEQWTSLFCLRALE